MSNDKPREVVSLDFLLPQNQPKSLPEFEIAGRRIRLLEVRRVEDFLLVLHAAFGGVLQIDKQLSAADEDLRESSSAEELRSTLDELASELRRLIQVFAPGLDDEFLAAQFPSVTDLQRLCVELAHRVWDGVPDYVKKNCRSALQATAQKKAALAPDSATTNGL